METKERPILFSAPMVRALLSGQKTQTRRGVKGMPVRTLEFDREWFANVMRPDADGKWTWWDGPPHGQSIYHSAKCPYGQVGDRLWVRETFVTGFDLDDNGQAVGDQKVWYRATDARLTWYDNDGETTMDNPPWKPSIHMPRWASRLTLQITDIRVERLQDISEADALAEGVQPRKGSPGPNFYTVDTGFFSANAPTASEVYRMLWEAINGDGSWAANPWVWAITFEVVK